MNIPNTSKIYILVLLLLIPTKPCHASKKALFMTASVITSYHVLCGYMVYTAIKKPLLSRIKNEQTVKKIALSISLPIALSTTILTNRYLTDRTYIILAKERVSPYYFKLLLASIKQYLYYTTLSSLVFNEYNTIQAETNNTPTKAPLINNITNYTAIKTILDNTKIDPLELPKDIIDEYTQIQTIVNQLLSEKTVSYDIVSQCSTNQETAIDVPTLLKFMDSYKAIQETQPNTVQSIFEEMFKTWNDFSTALYTDIQKTHRRFCALLAFEGYVETFLRISLVTSKKMNEKN